MSSTTWQSPNALPYAVVTENVKEDQPKLSQELAGPYKIMQDTAKRVATVSKELKPFLMDAMTEWVSGASFAKVCTMTSIFEGILSGIFAG